MNKFDLHKHGYKIFQRPDHDGQPVWNVFKGFRYVGFTIRGEFKTEQDAMDAAIAHFVKTRVS